MTATVDYGNVWVCTDCYFAHHYGATMVEREASDDEASDWLGGYLRTGHSVPNVVDETDAGLIIREWFAGDSDSPCDREPLALIDEGLTVTDNTCSDHEISSHYDADGEEVSDPCPHCHGVGWENGITDFSWSRCEGCGSTLGGARYRLHVWAREDVAS